MTLSAKITVDPKANKPVLTVTTDSRAISVTVTNQATGATATASGMWPVVVSDDSGHAWTPVSDNGTVAVFAY